MDGIISDEPHRERVPHRPIVARNSASVRSKVNDDRDDGSDRDDEASEKQQRIRGLGLLPLGRRRPKWLRCGRVWAAT